MERTPGNLLMPLPSLQVLKGSECSHLFTTSMCVWVQIPRMMLFTLEHFAGPPIGNLWNTKSKWYGCSSENRKPKILAAECDNISQACKHKIIMTEKLFKPGHSSDIQGRKRWGVYPMLFNPRLSKLHQLDLESVERLKQNSTKSKSCCSISENNSWCR